jgi:rhamnogalacturonan endolyase
VHSLTFETLRLNHHRFWLRFILSLMTLWTIVSARDCAGAFGLTTAADSYTVDTAAGLFFKVRRTDNLSNTQSAGDLMSLVFNGVEYQDLSRGSQINSGFDYLYAGVSAVTVTAAVVNVDYIKVTVTAGDLTHYYLARRGYPHIYMATHFATEPDTLGLCRFIVRIPEALLPNGPAPSDIRNNIGAIESADIFGMADGTTRSKHYSNMRLKDWAHIGATGANVGVWIVRSNHEGDSGGPFYRSLLNQCGSDQEITYILNYGEAQTEPFRTNILNGPYTLAFTSGGLPPALDTTWVSSMGLTGYVTMAGRGAVACGGFGGRDTSYDYTVGFANGQSQYWTDAAATSGSFVMGDMLPGTYSMRVFKGELAVHTTSVTVTAGGTNQLGSFNITGDPSSAKPLWRIGNWDGTPNEFLNGDRITIMHPSDVRLGTWNPGPYVVGSSSPATGMPCYQWKDVNGAQVVQFTLAAGQILASTIRIGITTAFEGAKITVNAYTSANPSPSTQPDTRTLTVGTYRGNNTTYTFAVPASAFVVGTNTLTIYPISGSGATGYLSAGYSLDCLDMYQGALQILPLPAAPTNLMATATNLQVSLKWNASSGATRYEVHRAIASGGPYERIESNLTTTYFLDASLPRATCYYVVRAGNSSGTGTNSSELQVVAGLDLASTLISAGAVWRYFDKTNDLGTSWRSNSFSDLAWSNGTARLGYGNDGEVTKVASNRQWTTYFRRQFHIPNPTNVVALDGRVTRDDAAVIYLNDTEIWRDTNITSGVITSTTPALVALGGADETNWLTLDLPTGTRSLLVQGWNTIAAEVHNQSLTSSDIGFNFELTGQVIISAPPRLAISREGGGIALAWPSDASYFALHSASNLMQPVLWRPATNAAVLSNSVWTVRPSTGANGRQFFRLQAE